MPKPQTTKYRDPTINRNVAKECLKIIDGYITSFPLSREDSKLHNLRLLSLSIRRYSQGIPAEFIIASETDTSNQKPLMEALFKACIPPQNVPPKEKRQLVEAFYDMAEKRPYNLTSPEYVLANNPSAVLFFQKKAWEDIQKIITETFTAKGRHLPNKFAEEVLAKLTSFHPALRVEKGVDFTL